MSTEGVGQAKYSVHRRGRASEIASFLTKHYQYHEMLGLKDNKGENEHGMNILLVMNRHENLTQLNVQYHISSDTLCARFCLHRDASEARCHKDITLMGINVPYPELYEKYLPHLPARTVQTAVPAF